VLEQAGPGQALEGALADLVGGLDVEGDAGDRAERAQPHDQAVEVGVAPRGDQRLAAGGDQLQAGDRGGQVAVAVAGAVGGGGHRAPDRDVGQRGQVGQGHPLGRQRLGQLAVERTAADSETVLAARSTTTSAGSPSREISAAESAMSLNECRDPRTRAREAPASSSRSCSTVAGRCRLAAR
jgi:hypothetical protein